MDRSRRAVCYAVGVLCGLAGCSETADQPTASETESPTRGASRSATPEATADTPPSETPTETTPTQPSWSRWTLQTGGGIESSPVVVGDTVYVGSRDETVYALDATDGTTRWTVETDDWVLASPRVTDGVVYIATGRRLYALDAASGDELWAKRVDGGIRSQPTVADGTVYVGSRDAHVYAFDRETGSRRWALETGRTHRSAVLAAPTVADGVVYVGNGNGTVVAGDAATGERLWKADAAGRVYADARVRGDTVYVGDGKGVLALSAADSARRWRVETPNGVRGLSGIDGSRLVAGYGERDTDGGVVAVDLDEQTAAWRTITEESVSLAPVVQDDTVYAGTWNDDDAGPPGRVLALDANNGNRRWTLEVPGGVQSAPAVTDTTLYQGTTNGRLHAIERSQLE